MVDNLKDLMITLQDEKVQTYSTYITAFAEKGINLSLKIKKVSYINNAITLVSEFQLVPKNVQKNKKNTGNILHKKLLHYEK